MDDDNDTVSALRWFLETKSPGIHVLQATDPSLATDMLYQHQVDVVASDYRMPGMDGVAFLSFVRRERPDAGTILLTGFNDAAIEEAARLAGIGAVLVKPFALKDFKAEIERLCAAAGKASHRH